MQVFPKLFDTVLAIRKLAELNEILKDIDIVKKLADLGFKVTITGGVEVEDIKLFKDIPIYIFIAGRSIRDAANPEEKAKEFKDEFKKY